MGQEIKAIENNESHESAISVSPPAKTYTLLLIEDNPMEVKLFQHILTHSDQNRSFALRQSDTLAGGLEEIPKGDIDLVVLDLGLPDNDGLEAIAKIHALDAGLPVVVLTGRDNKKLGLEAVRIGAQDYLYKGQVDADNLIPALRYAIERNSILTEAMINSQKDPLTGLLNRRGFMAQSLYQMRLAPRIEKIAILLYVDLDHMKQINDTAGHASGDLALIKTAQILKKVFRETDIIGRIGGDEFAIFAYASSKKDVEILRVRLDKEVTLFNEHKVRPFTLSLSIGAAVYDPKRIFCIEQLLKEADIELYRHKHRKYGNENSSSLNRFKEKSVEIHP